MNQHPTVDELIECPKKIIKSDRKNMIEKNRSYRNNIQLESEDGKYSFIMFMRQSAEFLEDFSVGLIWTNVNKYWDTKKQTILIRCQGPHDSKQEFESDPHHSYHIHKLSPTDIEQNALANLQIAVSLTISLHLTKLLYISVIVVL